MKDKMASKEEKIERLIKMYLKGEMAKMTSLTLQSCPSEVELCDYLESHLSQEGEELLLEHVANCPNCLSLLELAQRTKKRFANRPSLKMISRAKNIMQGKQKKIVFNQKWQLFAFLSFILSFIFTRYFVQFLVLAIIFSVKWIFDTGSTRTLIMIYEAWRKKEQGTAQRIIRDFENIITKKRFK